MKNAKRILVALLAATVLLSSFVLSAVASDEEALVGNIEDVLEYFVDPTAYENYENCPTTESDPLFDYRYADWCPKCKALGKDTYLNVKKANSWSSTINVFCPNASECGFKATKFENYFGTTLTIFWPKSGSTFPGVLKNVVKEGDNKVLKIENEWSNPFGYQVTRSNSEVSAVVSFKIKTEDKVFFDPAVNTGFTTPDGYDASDKNKVQPPELENGSCIKLIAVDSSSRKIEYTILEMNCHDSTDMYFSRYSDDGATKMSVKPALGTWYDIQVKLNFEKDVFSIEITPENGETVKSGELPLALVPDMKTVKLTIDDGKYTGTITWLDDFAVEEGTFSRVGQDVEAEVSKRLIALDNLAKSEDTSISDKIRIAAVYSKLFNEIGYVEKDTTPNKDAITSIREGANSYIYSTYIDRFGFCVTNIPDTYAERIKNTEEADVCSVFFDDDYFDGSKTDDEIKAKYTGISDEQIAAVKASKLALNKEIKALEDIKTVTGAFVNMMKDGYDSNNKNYVDMSGLYATILEVFPDRDYTCVCTDASGYNTSRAAEDFAELETKVKKIEEDASKFIANVAIMTQPSVASDVYYSAYVVAKGIYGDGVIHSGLDNATYPGLLAAIEAYNAERPNAERIAKDSEDFIYIIDTASKSTYYITIKNEILKAALYIDDDKDNFNIEPSYPGVTEAKAVYDSILAKLQSDEANAAAYIQAVNAIASASNYTQKRAAVDNAAALRVKGDVAGIAGIADANSIYEKAESEVRMLEGYSTALINAVNSLKNATTLEARRAYILVANENKDKAEPLIAGVTEAKAALEAAIASYDADVAALNAAFVGAIKTAGSVSGSVSSSAVSYKNADVINAAVK